jgi:hypothetical protein
MYLEIFHLIQHYLIYFLLFALFILILHKTVWNKIYSSVSNAIHQIFFFIVPFIFKFVLVTSSLICFHTLTKSYYIKGPRKTSEIIKKLLAIRSQLCSKKNVVTYHMKRIFQKIQNFLLQQSQQFYIQFNLFKNKLQFFSCLKKYQNSTQLLVTPAFKSTELKQTLKETIPQSVTLSNIKLCNSKHLNAFLGINSKHIQLEDTRRSLVTSQMTHEMTGVSPLMKLSKVENNYELWSNTQPFFKKQMHPIIVYKQLQISLSIQCFLQKTYSHKDATSMLCQAQNFCNTIRFNLKNFSLYGKNI